MHTDLNIQAGLLRYISPLEEEGVEIFCSNYRED